MEFLWASLPLLDDADPRAETAPVYQARPFAPYPVARPARILQLLADAPTGAPFARFLPDGAVSAVGYRRARTQAFQIWRQETPVQQVG